MLTEKINPQAYALLASEQQPVYGTVFEYPLNMTRSIAGGFTTMLTREQSEIEDKYTPEPPLTYYDDFGYKPLSTEKYKPESFIPEILELATTDKTSRGVFESEPLRYNPVSIYNQAVTQQSFPLDATSLNNDSLDTLITYRPQSGSPLGIGYTGASAYIQGSDPQSVAPVITDEEILTAPSDACGWYDFPCKFKQVKGEATILIVGVIILAIGIFALTR